jgi:hypothetical protein
VQELPTESFNAPRSPYLNLNLQDLEKKLRDMERRREDLALSAMDAKRQVDDAQKRLEVLVREQQEFDAAIASLQDKLAEQTRKAPPAGGMLVLTIHGKEAWFEFSLREMNTAGEVVGTVITREVEMLQKLLARTRNDPTAPKEFRVVADATAPAQRITDALKACAAAGFTNVKPIGPMPPGGMRPGNAKPDNGGGDVRPGRP